jgi:hypothetical protein
MKLSLYRRNFESNVPYAFVFNNRLFNCVNINIVVKHVTTSIHGGGGYGTIMSSNSDSLYLLELIDHYDFDDVNQLDQLLRDRNPELFL